MDLANDKLGSRDCAGLFDDCSEATNGRTASGIKSSTPVEGSPAVFNRFCSNVGDDGKGGLADVG